MVKEKHADENLRTLKHTKLKQKLRGQRYNAEHKI